jgi:flavin reductase (DIM6/NTAB) family NADH-FMN oxidoreductase RutF
MPEFDPAQLPARDVYFLLTSLVVPRPIAWVSSVDARGRRSLAPHSCFAICSSQPPVVQFTSIGQKESLHNVQDTGAFVVNVVSEHLVKPVNLTYADFPPGEDAFAWAGLKGAASKLVAPPRVASAHAVLECRLRRVLPVGNGTMVFGDVVHISVGEEVWRDGRVQPELLRPVARLAGSGYVTVHEVFRLPRATWAGLQGARDRPTVDD